MDQFEAISEVAPGNTFHVILLLYLLVNKCNSHRMELHGRRNLVPAVLIPQCANGYNVGGVEKVQAAARHRRSGT